MTGNLTSIVEAVWTHASRTLHTGGGGYSNDTIAHQAANAIWLYATRTVETTETIIARRTGQEAWTVRGLRIKPGEEILIQLFPA